MLNDRQDALGHCFKDFLEGKADTYFLEMDNGRIDMYSIKGFFNTYKHWLSVERKAMRYVRGSVLDIGCGVGRHALYLQEKGHDVVGIDQSPLAIQVCKDRGVKDARLLATTQIDSSLGMFDTFIMFGGNFGLVGSIEGAKRLLKRLSRVACDHARILAHTRDPYHPPHDPYWLEYHERNLQKGRMAGQNRMRVRYLGFTSPWFDWLLVSRDEMENIFQGTGWIVKRYIGTDTPTYVAVIEKKK